MQGPTVDKKLLQRFHDGNCTPAEREQILAWLERDDDEVLMLDDQKMDTLEDRIWSHIDPHRIRQMRMRRVLTWSGIAASVLLVMSFFLLQRLNTTGVSRMYAFGGDKPRSLDLSGLEFKLVGNSNATVVANHKQQTGSLTFCGVVEIANNSNADVHYTLNYGCASTKSSDKKVLLKKGGRYVAMRDHYHTNELIIISKEHLIEFPDALPAGVERI